MAEIPLVRKPAQATTPGEISNSEVAAIASEVSSSNIIINGNFDIWQRGVGPTVTTSGITTTDRFGTFRSGPEPTVTQSQETDVPNNNSNYSWKTLNGTAVGAIGASEYRYIRQIIEGHDIIPLLDKEITLSFWVKSSLAGVYSIAFVNGGSDRTYLAEYTINTVNTWEKKIITIDMTGADDSGTWEFTNGRGLRIRWALSAGTNWHETAGSWSSTNKISTANQVDWAATTGATFFMSQVMLNVGSVAAPFKRSGGTIQEELANCQRYYWRQQGTSQVYASGYSVSGTISRYFVRHPVEMRDAPIFSHSGSIGTNFIGVVIDSVNNPSAISADLSTPLSMRLVASGHSAMSVGVGTRIEGSNANGFFEYNAEL